MTQRIHNILRQLTLLLSIYFAMRLIFLIYHWGKLSQSNLADLIGAFMQGVRFDLSTILILHAPFIVYFLFAPFKMNRMLDRIADKALFTLFIAIHGFFFCAGFADNELIIFNGRRLTYHFFGIKQDIYNQIAQMIMHFWYLSMPVIMIIILFARFIPWKTDYKNEKSNSILTNAVIILAVLFILPIGVRGGLQNKPLKPTHAYIYRDPLLGHLTLNSTFSIIFTRNSKPEETLSWINNEEVSKYLSYPTESVWHTPFKEKQNVVILILESFALEYIGAANSGVGYTPFLDKLSKDSLFYRNCFANGRRSIEAVPSILASLPSLLRDAFLTSNYQGIRLKGLPQVLQENDYSTSFFHAAQNGSMFFNSFSARVGVEKYFGLNEYTEKKDYDGYWGIWDEPYYQYFIKNINNFKKPFFSTLFTLSSHQPYRVPEQYNGRFPSGPLEIHETLGYADYALEQFFKSAEKTDWFKNTFFIITGDHTSKSIDPKYQDEVGPFRIPLVIYHPRISNWNNIDQNRVVQHADIFPTVLDLLGIDKVGLPRTGQSVFSKSEGFSVNRVGERFWYRSQNYFLEMFEDNRIEVSKINEQGYVLIENDSAEITEHKMRFKAYVQNFINGVLTDKLLP